MNRRKYQKELERIIEQNGEKKPSVLLHSCCGPCSSSVLEYLTRYFRVTVLWYNPNLYPEEEYFRRLETQKELLCKMGLSEQVGLLVIPWQSEKYYKAVAGYENEPEGGRRCEKCFELRLQECARIAKSGNFDYFCSTLTVSRHKNAVLINRIGENEGEKEEVCWLPSDFKKHNGENRSVELSEKYGIYRQVYCGCEFSLKARMQPKKQELTERKDTENE